MTATDRDDSETLRAITQEWLRAIAGIRIGAFVSVAPHSGSTKIDYDVAGQIYDAHQPR